MEKVRENKDIVLESINEKTIYDLQCPQCNKQSTYCGFFSTDIVICPCCGREIQIDFQHI